MIRLNLRSRGIALLVAVAALDPWTAEAQTYRQRRKELIDGLPLASRTDAAKTGQGREGERAARNETGEPKLAPETGVGASGQELVAEAAQRVYSLPSLQAQLRMKLFAHGRQIVAAGDYLQVGASEEKLLKLNLKIPVGNKIGSVQQIRGPHYLWVIRDMPPDDPKLERVTLRTARLEILKGEQAGRLPLEGWILLGGLSRLLASLENNFEFASPRPALLGDVPVLVLRGQWKPAALKRLTGAKSAELPSPLPYEVELTVGGRDQPYPLFPYRIEYLRRDEEQGRGADGDSRTLALIEFFEVSQARNVDRGEFEFDPEDRDIDDVTMSYLRRLGIVPAKP